MNDQGIPSWAKYVIRAPGGGEIQIVADILFDNLGREIGRIESGIVRIKFNKNDEAIKFYHEVGGAHFYERSRIPYAMTSLDTPIYHSYLEKLQSNNKIRTIVDVGGGDGRNALPWLYWQTPHVIVVDAAFQGLTRFRARIAQEMPEALNRLLLIEADARELPLINNCSDCLISIESLAYLNDDYKKGLTECARVMTNGSRLLIAERDYEGALLMRLFYFGGIDGMLKYAHTRQIWDGSYDKLVKSLAFTEAQLTEEIRSSGFHIDETKGISLLSLALSSIKERDEILSNDSDVLNKVLVLLKKLGNEGYMRRAHVIFATKE